MALLAAACTGLASAKHRDAGAKGAGDTGVDASSTSAAGGPGGNSAAVAGAGAAAAAGTPQRDAGSDAATPDRDAAGAAMSRSDASSVGMDSGTLEDAGTSHDAGTSYDAASDSGSAPPPTCGDGHVDPGESCDSGSESATCNGDCTVRACGDHKTNAAAGEDCDDGKNGDDADGCTDSCTYSCQSDGDCGPSYGGRCAQHACVPLAFGSATMLAMSATLGRPVVAMDGRGNALAVWADNGALHHAWYSPANGWNTESVLVPNGKYPSVASDGRGNLLLAYSATDPNTAKLEHVYMRRYRPGNGAPVPDPSGWRAEFELKSYSNYNPTGNNWIWPKIAMAGNGDAWLAWTAQQQSSGAMGSSATWVANCDNAADTCLAASSIDSGTRLRGHPQVAVDDSGFYPIVTWSMFVDTGFNPLIRAARYESAWTLSDAASATSPDLATPGPLTVDGTGQAWFAITRVAGGAISGSVLRNRRATLLDPFAWASPQASPRSLPLSIAANAAGDVLGLCYELTNSNTKLSMIGAALPAGSQTWSAEAPLESLAFDPSMENPRVAIDGYGHGVGLWVDDDGAKSAVTATRVVRNASVTWSSPSDISARTVNTLSGIQLSLEADGRGAALWLEDDGSQTTAWASEFR